MVTHQTIFSQTCRIIANPTRLQLLWNVFENKQYCVKELAVLAKISASNASNQLQILTRSGLILPARGKHEVIYKPDPTPAMICAQYLLPTLKECRTQDISFEQIIHQATAFTHERRIQMARCLAVSDETFETLLDKTGMTVPSLNRHARKLVRRNVIEKTAARFRLMKPDTKLSRCLLTLAVHQDNGDQIKRQPR